MDGRDGIVLFSKKSVVWSDIQLDKDLLWMLYLSCLLYVPELILYALTDNCWNEKGRSFIGLQVIGHVHVLAKCECEYVWKFILWPLGNNMWKEGVIQRVQYASNEAGFTMCSPSMSKREPFPGCIMLPPWFLFLHVFVVLPQWVSLIGLTVHTFGQSFFKLWHSILNTASDSWSRCYTDNG